MPGRLFTLMTVLLVAALLSLQAEARYAMALGYEPKYPQDFEHFDYVNPDAPRRGHFTLSAFGTFETLNPFLLKSLSAAGLQTLVFETLMVQSRDEPFTMYGLLANDIELADDRESVTFRLNPDARFSNGDPVLAKDVKASFEALTGENAHPQYRLYWQDVEGATVLDERTIRFDFARPNPELHLITAELPVFSHKWIGDRPFDEVTTERPIASGPYTIESFAQGDSITYKRDPNYWAEDLNVRRGMFNFERVTYEYYRDFTVAFEAFKAGEFDFYHELHSKRWAREYHGPAFESGRIKRELLSHKNNAGMQGFMFNLRRPLFQDRRIRQAINLAFDFPWANHHLFYDQYRRATSYFSNSELAARDGPPEGQVRAILHKHSEALPDGVFGPTARPPSTSNEATLRDNLLRARELLREAGWQVDDQGVLRNDSGEAFRFEFLLAQEGFERILAPFFRNLERLGMRPEYRTVDSALYQQRVRSFNFDMAVMSFPQSQSPGNELRSMFHSDNADRQGSRNYMGISDPGIDALIEEVVYARDRDRLVAAARALDRALLHGNYLVPNWYIDAHRVAYREELAMPETQPLYYQAEDWVLESWWTERR